MLFPRCNSKIIILIAILGSGFLLACASYKSKTYETKSFIQQGRSEEALVKLESLAAEESKDRLLYLLDYATVLQMTNQYQKSSEIFIEADKLIDLNDYHSISKVVGATLGGEEVVQYKGESYEKFLINTMNAINFLMLGQFDSALVEAKQINEKINKMKMDGRDPYDESPFARYLAGLIWESQNQFDDAYIEYEASYKLDSTNPFLPSDLLLMSKKTQRTQSFDKWSKEFPSRKIDPQSLDKTTGELIVIFQQGWGVQKVNRPGQYRFPSLKPTFNQTAFAQVQINGTDYGLTRKVYSVDQAAIETLEKDFGALVARRIGGIAAKAVFADQIRQKNQLLGDLSWIAMNLTDRADLRHWQTLPSSFHLSKIHLKPGKYKVRLIGQGPDGFSSGEFFEKEIEIKSRRKTFINWRSIK